MNKEYKLMAARRWVQDAIRSVEGAAEFPGFVPPSLIGVHPDLREIYEQLGSAIEELRENAEEEAASESEVES